MSLFVFIAKHAAVLALVLLTAVSAGTWIAGRRDAIAFRAVVGFAAFGHAMFVLAAMGQLRPWAILAVTSAFIAGGAFRVLRVPAPDEERHPMPRLLLAGLTVLAVLAFTMALMPPIAFDETLYHLPFVTAYARGGTLEFLVDTRMPVFPILHELLCVGPLLIAGDVAPHLVALAQVAAIAALLIGWGSRYHTRAGPLAAAMLLGSPLVVYYSNVLYVDVALTMFVATAFYALDRDRPGWAGFLLGTACAVKYLAWYFVAAAFVLVVVRRGRSWRRTMVFVLSAAMTALPTTLWIFASSGDPLFPFVRPSIWELPPEPVAFGDRVVGALRAIWDASFDRARMGQQPPMTPFFGAFLLIVLIAALKDARARTVALLSCVYLIIFAFLPQDSRYLLPIVPLVCVVASVALATRWPKAVPLLALVALLPGLAYACYRVSVGGVPPHTPEGREQWLSARLPGYQALARAGEGPVYVCGGEQLKSYSPSPFLGDFAGPYSYASILRGGEPGLADRLHRTGARSFLVVKKRCEVTSEGMKLVYADAHAQLWRVP